MINREKINEAIVLTQSGKFSEAEKLYLELLKENSEDYLVLTALGLFYVNIKQFDNAILYLKKALTIKESFGTVSALGFAYFEIKDYEQSANFLELSLNHGENQDIYNKLILSLFYMKNYTRAIDFSTKMYEKYPNDSNAVANLVKALTYCGKLREAETLCVNFLKENPNSPSLWFHLGFLKELIYDNDIQACECYKIALNLGSTEAYYNLGVSYQKQRDYLKAEENYKKMLEHSPENKDTMVSLGMCLLTQKKFEEGYSYYFKGAVSPVDKLTNNMWKKGDELKKEVVVLCDQGFGDQIQFSRYLPLLKEKVEIIHLATRDSLKDLFRKNFPFVNIIDYKDVKPDMQAIKITALPYVLNVDFDHIPYATGYIDSENAKIEKAKFKLGLCWEAGSVGIRTMINRSINIKLFEPILNLEHVQTYSFQVQDSMNGNEKYPQMINLAKDFKNFSDTARALKSMDLVITVDTCIAHLSGALGIKTYLILPKASDWRWFDDTKTTPWYNSIEIHKYSNEQTWNELIKKIINDINNLNKQ